MRLFTPDLLAWSYLSGFTVYWPWNIKNQWLFNVIIFFKVCISDKMTWYWCDNCCMQQQQKKKTMFGFFICDNHSKKNKKKPQTNRQKRRKKKSLSYETKYNPFIQYSLLLVFFFFAYVFSPAWLLQALVIDFVWLKKKTKLFIQHSFVFVFQLDYCEHTT